MIKFSITTHISLHDECWKSLCTHSLLAQTTTTCCNRAGPLLSDSVAAYLCTLPSIAGHPAGCIRHMPQQHRAVQRCSDHLQAAGPGLELGLTCHTAFAPGPTSSTEALRRHRPVAAGIFIGCRTDRGLSGLLAGACLWSCHGASPGSVWRGGSVCRRSHRRADEDREDGAGVASWDAHGRWRDHASLERQCPGKQGTCTAHASLQIQLSTILNPSWVDFGVTRQDGIQLATRLLRSTSQSSSSLVTNCQRVLLLM